MTDTDRHVVIVSQHYPPDNSGNASRVHDMSKHLSDRGWDVTVLAPPPAFPHGEFGYSWTRQQTRVDDGVTVHRLWAHQPTAEDPSFRSRLAYYLLFPLHALLWLALHRNEVDIIITSSPPIFTGIAGLPFGVIGNTKLVVDVRDLWIDASIGLGFIEEGGLLERVSRLYQRTVLTVADRVSVTTDELGAELTAQYGVSSDRLVHLPNGVETSLFAGEGETGSRTLVYTGNVGHAQALDTCVRALQYMETNAHLKIVGDGDQRAALEELAADLGVADRVEFTGLVPRETIPDILSDAAVGLAPLQDSETLEYAVPTKAYEYMAAGLPVVATSTGELERLIETAECGVVTANDPEELGAALDGLLADPGERDRLGENGQAYAVEQYDRDAIAGRLDDELQTLLG